VSLRLVIFDMDDVLCRYDLGARLRALSRLTGQTPRDIRAAIWDSGFEDLADSGGIASSEAYLAQFGEKLGFPISRAQWAKARRESMVAWPDMLAAARAISQNHEIALYTNNGPMTRECLPDLFPQAHELFGDRAFFSYQFGTKKPDPLAYTRLLEHLGRAPSETLFIDDKLSNVKGARLAGLKGHHFTSPETFLAEAEMLGILKRPIA
jgi:HAD superfamily hydrolase (TIGR01509 family)